MTSTSPEELRIDYYRAMVLDPPTDADPAAHLVWVRLMARVLVELDEWAPHFTLALVSKYRSLELMRGFCADGGYERSLEQCLPHPLGYLLYFLEREESAWLKDLARCEVWTNCLRGVVPAEHRQRARDLLGIQAREQTDFIVVTHDVLETLQTLVGYADMGMSRAGRILWYLGVTPIYPVLAPRPRAGIVAFIRSGSGAELRFVPLD